MTDSEIEIETDVPMPDRPGLYPFAAMEIGHSILVSAEQASRARNAARMWGQRNDRIFTARKQEDGSMRIWRID